MPAALSGIVKRDTLDMTVKAVYKGGYTIRRYFNKRKLARKNIDERIKDSRIKYIDVIPRQNYTPASMEHEADKGGYNIEKYQKIFT